MISLRALAQSEMQTASSSIWTRFSNCKISVLLTKIAAAIKNFEQDEVEINFTNLAILLWVKIINLLDQFWKTFLGGKRKKKLFSFNHLIVLKETLSRTCAAFARDDYISLLI